MRPVPWGPILVVWFESIWLEFRRVDSTRPTAGLLSRGEAVHPSHDSLGRIPPAMFRRQVETTRNSTSELCH